MTRKFDVLFLVADGIGNVLEALYALEYCIHNSKNTGLVLSNIPASFVKFLRSSYGADVILDTAEGVTASHLVHSWLFRDRISVQFKSYFLVWPTSQNTAYLSETEQYLSIVRGLYPSDFNSTKLTLLQEDYSDRLKALAIEDKVVIYPGCSSHSPSKRWPYFGELVAHFGKENVVVVGGADDLRHTYSFLYPDWITALIPRRLLRRPELYNALKRLGVLRAHAHLNRDELGANCYFDIFTWAELTALMRRAKAFVGNDGGLTHLAGACGASGAVIFGPTSVNKNRPYNPALKPISQSFDCQPCQFIVNGKDSMSKNSILCPHQIRCLYSVPVDQVIQAVQASAIANTHRGGNCSASKAEPTPGISTQSNLARAVQN